MWKKRRAGDDQVESLCTITASGKVTSLIASDSRLICGTSRQFLDAGCGIRDEATVTVIIAQRSCETCPEQTLLFGLYSPSLCGPSLDSLYLCSVHYLRPSGFLRRLLLCYVNRYGNALFRRPDCRPHRHGSRVCPTKYQAPSSLYIPIPIHTRHSGPFGLDTG